MPVHNVGGREVVVSPRSRNFFFYRSQGISVNIDPDRHWYCLWLCSSTSDIERMEFSIVLSGVAGTTESSNSCTGCGALNVMGPSFSGINVPQSYQNVSYQGTVRIEGEVFSVSGAMAY